MFDLLDVLNKKIPFTDIEVINVFYMILTIIIGYFLAVLLSRYIGRIMFKAKFAKILVEFTRKVVKILIIIFSLSTAVGFLGVDVGAGVISLSVVSGFIFGFAFQETLGNLASGFMIAVTKPFKIGDYIEVDGKSGSVKNVGATTTTLSTYDNKKIIIPNSSIWNKAVTNYTAMKTRLIDINVGISYSDDIGKAIETIMGVLKTHKKVLKKPDPLVAVDNLGDSSVNLIVRPWVKTGDYWTMRRELTRMIKEKLDEAGITIPFPQRDIHLIKG